MNKRCYALAVLAVILLAIAGTASAETVMPLVAPTQTSTQFVALPTNFNAFEPLVAEVLTVEDLFPEITNVMAIKVAANIQVTPKAVRAQPPACPAGTSCVHLHDLSKSAGTMGGPKGRFK